MKKIKIDKIYRNVTRKDGSEYVDKRGKKFTHVTIYTTGKDGNQHKLSHCDYDDWTASFSENQIIMLNIEKNGDFINFSKPTKADMLEVVVSELDKRVVELEAKADVLVKPVVESMQEAPMPEPEPPIVDLPF